MMSKMGRLFLELQIQQEDAELEWLRQGLAEHEQVMAEMKPKEIPRGTYNHDIGDRKMGEFWG